MLSALVVESSSIFWILGVGDLKWQDSRVWLKLVGGLPGFYQPWLLSHVFGFTIFLVWKASHGRTLLWGWGSYWSLLDSWDLGQCLSVDLSLCKIIHWG